VEEERLRSTHMTREEAAASNSKERLDGGHGPAITSSRQHSDGKFVINHTVILSCVGLKLFYGTDHTKKLMWKLCSGKGPQHNCKKCTHLKKKTT